MNGFSLRPRLVGDEGVADHVGGDVFDLAGSFDEVDPPLKTVFKMAFTPSAGMDLGLDDEAVTRQAAGNRFSLLRTMGHSSPRNRHPSRGQ